MKTPLALSTVVVAGVAWLAVSSPARAALINHWKFDESAGSATAIDSAGGLDLALQGAADFIYDATRGDRVLALPASKVDYALNASGVPFGSDTTHTVGVWVKHDSSGNRYQGLLSWGASGARYFFGTSGPHNGGRAWTGVGNVTLSFTASDASPLEDTWQYWTFVREGTTGRLYLDGNLLQTVTVASGGSINTTEELRVGRYYGDFPESAGGKFLDDLAIWDEALTPQQIAMAMILGAQNYNAVPEPSSLTLLFFAALGTPLVLWWRGRRTGH